MGIVVSFDKVAIVGWCGELRQDEFGVRQRAAAGADVVAVAGVGPVGWMIGQFGPDGIEMDIAGEV